MTNGAIHWAALRLLGARLGRGRPGDDHGAVRWEPDALGQSITPLRRLCVALRQPLGVPVGPSSAGLEFGAEIGVCFFAYPAIFVASFEHDPGAIRIGAGVGGEHG